MKTESITRNNCPAVLKSGQNDIQSTVLKDRGNPTIETFEFQTSPKCLKYKYIFLDALACFVNFELP